MSHRYSILGLGKLGCSMAAAIAKRGFQVIGVDILPEAVKKINQGLAPVEETNLADTIAANQDRLKATLDCKAAILESDLTFVIVPTPSGDDGKFSLQYAAWAFKEIGQALSGKNDYHNVVLTSTVLPGSTRYGLMPILERESGKVCGKDFGLCYSPEFIALGSVIQDFLNPDFNLIGEIDDRAGSQLEESYKQIMENNPPCKRMSLENAELTKVSLNTFVTTKITYANMLADLCEQIPGGDVDVVTDALGMDSRIGPKYLKGALGYGGPCFPRDNVALGAFAKEMGVSARLAEITDQLNRNLSQKIVKRLRPYIKPNQTVAVFGLSYKPHSHIIEESQGIFIAKALAESGVRVIAYDPLASRAGREELRDRALIFEDMKTCLNQAQLIVIANSDPEFCSLKAEDFPSQDPPVIVFDCWRILREKLEGCEHLCYIPLGIGTMTDEGIRKLEHLWHPYTD